MLTYTVKEEINQRRNVDLFEGKKQRGGTGVQKIGGKISKKRGGRERKRGEEEIFTAQSREAQKTKTVGTHTQQG